MVANCDDQQVDLVLVSDVLQDPAKHLQLFSQAIDTFASGQETPGQLRVAMATVGSDNGGESSVTWLFKFETFSKPSEIKKAIMQGSDRSLSEISYLEEAIEFVDGELNDIENLQAKNGSTQATVGVQNTSKRTPKGKIFSDDNSVDDSNLSSVSSGVTDGIKSGINADFRRVTVILALTDIIRALYSGNKLSPERFHSNKKLLIMIINPMKQFTPCSNILSVPCIDLLPQTMLEDPSLSIALCGRCSNQWFGPFPTPDTNVDLGSVLAYTSCYRTLDVTKPYALSAMEQCLAVGGSLVSMETELELEYLRAQLSSRKIVWSYGKIHVFIGLLRDSASLGKRFRWISKRPLTFNRWAAGNPLGGYMHGCVFWDFYFDQWHDFGCGKSFDALPLCEWTQKIHPEISELSKPPPPPGETSVHEAWNRGEILVCHLSDRNSSLLPVLAASHVFTKAAGCKLQVNNTGEVQVVNLPLRRDWVFFCEEESAGYILYSKVCDQTSDCSNDRDESTEICRRPQGRQLVGFTCATSKRIVEEEAQCDLYDDCTDNSDEENCDTCQFGLCSDGQCVPQPWLIDGHRDCVLHGNSIPDRDNSINLEEDCAFLCNRSKCVSWSKLGDGVVDCLGPEGPLDETLGSLERADCVTSEEWSPKCIYQKDRLGELIGCRSLIHLQGCEAFDCPEGYIKCPRTYCIPAHYINNGVMDCPMGEDEAMDYKKPELHPGYFRCDPDLDESVILHPDRFCDGSKDCRDGSDELGCHVTCTEGFLCIGGIVVVDSFDRSRPLVDISFVDPRTRMIDFSHINMSVVLPSIGQLDLNYLIDLRLSDCSLTHALVPTPRFDILSKLDLSYNLFRNITQESSNPRVIYYGLRSLRFLNLSHNALLEVFDTRTLQKNSALRTLDLSHTDLTTFPEMAQISDTLMYLNLSHTRIKRLASFTFPGGHKAWRLEILDLHKVDIEEVQPGVFRGLTITSHLNSDYFKLCCPQIRGAGVPAHTCHAPSDPLSSCFDLLENRLLRILVWIMGVASLLGNLGVIVTRLASGRATLQLTYAQFVIQLGVSDFLMGVYLIIIGYQDVRSQGDYVWHDDAWLNSGLCRTAGFLSTMSSEVSSVFILLITLDRYLVIRFPFGQHRLLPATVVTLSCLAWGVGITLAAVPLLPWTNHWKLYSSNAVCLGLPLLPGKAPGWQFSTAVFIVLNFLLFLGIASGQLAIFRAASAHRRAAPVTTSYNSSTFNSHWSTQLSPRMREDVAIARRLAAVAFTDLLCCIPIGVLGLLSLRGHSLGGEAYAWTAVFILPINSALNPLLYSLPVIRGIVAQAVARCLATIRRNWPRPEAAEPHANQDACVLDLPVRSQDLASRDSRSSQS